MLLNGAVVAVQENWVTLVDQDESAVLEWVSCVNETKLVLHYLHDVKVKIQTHGAALKCSLTLHRDYGVVILYEHLSSVLSGDESNGQHVGITFITMQKLIQTFL